MENKNLEQIKNWLLENITGLLALAAGFFLLYFTLKILVNLILFSVGLILIYIGFVKLRIKPITNFFDRMGVKIKKFLS